MKAMVIRLWLFLAITGHAGTITLSGDAASNATGYVVRRSLTNSPTFTVVEMVPATALSVSIASLGGMETFTVMATNLSGTSGPSNFWMSTSPIITPPEVPTGLYAATITGTRIDLVWNSPTNATPIAVELSLDNRTFSQVALLNMPVGFYINSNLKKKTTYWFRMRASNASGWSAYTQSLAAKTGMF